MNPVFCKAIVKTREEVETRKSGLSEPVLNLQFQLEAEGKNLRKSKGSEGPEEHFLRHFLGPGELKKTKKSATSSEHRCLHGLSAAWAGWSRDGVSTAGEPCLQEHQG